MGILSKCHRYATQRHWPSEFHGNYIPTQNLSNSCRQRNQYAMFLPTRFAYNCLTYIMTYIYGRYGTKTFRHLIWRLGNLRNRQNFTWKILHYALHQFAVEPLTTFPYTKGVSSLRKSSREDIDCPGTLHSDLPKCTIVVLDLWWKNV